MSAALASIMQQESSGTGVAPSTLVPDEAKNFELTEAQEKYLEEKILAILERNRRGEGYVQQAQMRQQQQSESQEDESQQSGEENLLSS